MPAAATGDGPNTDRGGIYGAPRDRTEMSDKVKPILFVVLLIQSRDVIQRHKARHVNAGIVGEFVHQIGLDEVV